MSHKPEPWKHLKRPWMRWDSIEDHDGDRIIKSCEDEEGIEEEDAHRIVACVNFCREFPTEFLEAHRLNYLHSGEDLKTWDYAGYAACELLPVVKTKDEE